MSLVDGDDNLFNHVLRQDMRRAVWSRGFIAPAPKEGPAHPREEFQGVHELGIDYEATVRNYRKKRRKGKGKEGTYSGRNLED